MVRAVIFDVGGVLVRTPDRQSRLLWEKKLGLDEWASEAIVFGGEMGTGAQLGVITDDELWSWTGKRLGLSAEELSAFRRDFWAGDVLDSTLINLIRGLRPRYQTAIISNATDALRKTLTDVYSIADAFDLIVCSAEENVMKPHEEIYHRALARLSREPEEAVFIDDSEVNVVAARDLGMHAIQFKPSMNVSEELAGLGVKGD